MNRERGRKDREEGERDLFSGLAAWAKPDETCYDVLHQSCVRACRNARTRIKTTHKHTNTHVSIKVCEGYNALTDRDFILCLGSRVIVWAHSHVTNTQNNLPTTRPTKMTAAHRIRRPLMLLKDNCRGPDCLAAQLTSSGSAMYLS